MKQNIFQKFIVCIAIATASGTQATAQTAEIEAAAPTPTPIRTSTPDHLRRSWLPPAQVLEGQSESEGTKSLEVVAKTMSNIVTDLHEERTNTSVQEKQKIVVSSLDAMIKDLEKKASGGGGGGMNPSKPMSKSTLAGGPGGIHDLHDPRAGEKQWGTLKPKEREQILQSKTDGFPAGYESLLQSYYRRLANEDGGQEGAASPPAPASSTGTQGTAAP